MGMKKIFRKGFWEKEQETKCLRLLNSGSKNVKNLKIETCFYFEVEDFTTELLEKLIRILGDYWEDNCGLSEFSRLANSFESQPVEIGPRLSYSTPWSTNCVSILKSIGVNTINRIEKSSRYFIEFEENVPNHEKVIENLYDEMTEQVYESPLKTFSLNRKPDSWSVVDVLNGGVETLKKINSEMGLAFDSWDLEYYTKLFCERIGRNPTTVELFDLAQSNSEHSRHWFFKGKYNLNGKELPNSLFKMVMNTNLEQTTNQNNVIKFSDNSSGIKGYKLPFIKSANPLVSNELKVSEETRHIIFTAETHNFPTGVCPFSGATTGTGGRIRDVQAAGRGGHVVAGTAGYCFGNLLIPGYNLEWENADAVWPSNFATALEVAIEASNGASEYGNKFGEPVIAGFSRSFGAVVGNEKRTERREWVKPIMFSAGIGTLDDKMINKIDPKAGQLVMKVGGPVYRIGVGGGAASSVQVQGDNMASRDFGAVQRGDAEMEQKLNRFIRGCLECGTNPILAIHDQGAGGNANVLKELMEGAGGVIFIKAFSLGDETLSTLEIWGAEYQESNAILVNPGSYNELKILAERERCPIDVVGVITDDHKVRLYETEFKEKIPAQESDDLAVNLDLDCVLGKMPQKVFEWTEAESLQSTISFPTNVTVLDALNRVLRLPSVASKRYLTNKVDRSVTGLIAQQQCVGPLQTPLADVAVTALSYFSTEGAATSIGEQPIKLLVDPEKGARMTVFEALTNLASASISHIRDIKCSANWMWAAKLPGEGYSLYKACEAMCDVMKILGIAVDGGKDSLSMAARIPGENSGDDVVKAPGSLVVSAYAPCPDITKTVTPDLKRGAGAEDSILILLKPALNQFRLGGSALAQVFGEIGSDCPDLNREEVDLFISTFEALQKLINSRLIESLHDVSDGGVVTCLIEMAIAGLTGFDVTLPSQHTNAQCTQPALEALFNEETGWILEVAKSNYERLTKIVEQFGIEKVLHKIGHTAGSGVDSLITVRCGEKTVLSLPLIEALLAWEETSFQIEKLQMNRTCAEEEFSSYKRRHFVPSIVQFEWREAIMDPRISTPKTPKISLIREEGTNGDREMAAAFIMAGFIVHDVTMSDLIDLKVDLEQFRGIVFPGGFSYGDVLGSAVGWAASIKENKILNQQLQNWSKKSTTFSLGVCNGCQLLALLGWVGCGESIDYGFSSVRLNPNDSGRFESRWTRVKIHENSNSILLSDMVNSTLGIWVAHGEGKFAFKDEIVKKNVENKNCVAMQYVNDQNTPTTEYPFNPNGSQNGIAGISSACGRHLALMPHPERCVLEWQQPYVSYEKKHSMATPWLKIFQNAFDWCIKN